MVVKSAEAIQRNILNILKVFRLKNGLTQQKMATRLGTSLRTYQRIEGGEVEPSLSQLIKMSMELGVKLEHLIDANEVNELSTKKQNIITPYGGWFLDLSSRNLQWTKVTRLIHEVPDDFSPTLEFAISQFKEGLSRDIASRALEKTIESGISFEIEAELMTYKGQEIMVCVKGLPEQIDGKTIGIHGTYQNVTAKYNSDQKIRIPVTPV